MKLPTVRRVLQATGTAVCGLLVSISLCGCQSQPLTPEGRAQQLLQHRAEVDRVKPAEQEMQTAAVPPYRQETEPAAEREGSRWTNWLGRLPKPQRIPLPRTDMGGNDIAVLEPGLTTEVPERQ